MDRRRKVELFEVYPVKSIHSCAANHRDLVINIIEVRERG